MLRYVAALGAAALITAGFPLSAQAAPTVTQSTVTNPNDGTKIAITEFKPEGASATSQVPVIFQSHGWGGQRSQAPTGEITAFLEAGFGVVSIDQRGHGQSGGQANVQDPDLEAEDIQAVIDHVAGLDWVLHDTDASGQPIPNDPVLGAIGGSYGGGYQTMTALDEIQETGSTRFNALVPEITWYDLPESLAPQRVPRTAWTAVLYGAGARMLPQYVHVAQAWGASTGQWPDGTLYGQPFPAAPDLDSEFHEHGPVAFVERGVKLDIPVLVRQGASDNLFNLNQGLQIFRNAVTDEARSQSFFVSGNGGHNLPNVAPPGAPMGAPLGMVDACSGNWTAKRIDFFQRVFSGTPTEGLYPTQYSFTDLDQATCIPAEAFSTESLPVDPLGTGGTVTTTGVGAPQHLEIADGPRTITGIPTLKGTVTALGLDSRAFFGLSMGTTPATATVIDNNLMPLRQVLPGVDVPFEIELPGVAVNVPEGQSLYLTVTPFSDMFFGHGSRPPGAMVLNDLTVTLPKPTVGGGEEEPVQRASALSLRAEGNGSNARLVATLTDAESGGGLGGQSIEFFGDGASLGTATTDGTGVATLGLTGRNRGGRHLFEAVFGGNSDYFGSRGSTQT